MWRAPFVRIIIILAAILLIATAVSSEPGKGDKSIFDLLMPGQEAQSTYSWPDPPAPLRTLIERLVHNVQKVDLCIYVDKSGKSESEMLSGFESVLTQQGWSKRVGTRRPGRGFDGLFSRQAKSGPYELMLIEISDKAGKREVSFTKIVGEESGDSQTLVQPIMRKQVPASVNVLRIKASGPSIQYEAWAKDMVEISKLQPSGQFKMPEIVTDGSAMSIDLPASMAQQDSGFGMSVGLDYTIRGPQRLSISIDSTGSPVTVDITGIMDLDLKAANAPLTIIGKLMDGKYKIEAVNKKAVLSLRDVQKGDFRLAATNADITLTMPLLSSVQLSANAVAGSVSYKSGSESKTDNPLSITKGSGGAKIFLESVSGKIVVNLK